MSKDDDWEVIEGEPIDSGRGFYSQSITLRKKKRSPNNSYAPKEGENG